MVKRKIHGYPVLILGAGRGGYALLEMFLEDDLVEVVGIVDSSADAPGMILAQKFSIPIYTDIHQALQACTSYPDCIIYNLTHDDSVIAEVKAVLNNKQVTSGPEAKLFWQIVTNLKRIKGELETSQNQLNAIIHHAMDGIITVSDTGEIQAFNPAAEEIFGYSQNDVLGQHVKMLLSDETQQAYAADIARYLQSGQRGSIGIRGQEVVAIKKNGEQFPMEVSASEMEIKGQRYFVGIVRDVTERKLVEQKITHLAHHDYLTGLPNRALFLEQLEHSITMARRNRYKVAVLFLDLDGFKQVNDTLGHDAGDVLLQEVGKRLKSVIRESDIVARIGGDEFTFILNNVGEDANAAWVAQKVIDVLALPIDLKDQPCHIGGSIGIAIYPDSSSDFETLLKQADEAMYWAKQNGKNTFRIANEGFTNEH
ncbi:PAS domain S-box protein [Novimethylophilus kurashikiensis]|uniref:PAS domain S-box protein n=1 Tax=Novimethylophilus kurashikiensis TaxID=1825523 RepID=A0A2R5F1D4_9PROT|nr:diguanylate cyclase [Novimethylophilus kurashikiensis]GBG12530.1 PAS domain S-box protein [Novimethylophilus kurashikiensis]